MQKLLRTLNIPFSIKGEGQTEGGWKQVKSVDERREGGREFRNFWAIWERVYFYFFFIEMKKTLVAS